MNLIKAAARRGTCEALGGLDVPSTADIVSGVLAGLGKSRLNISGDIGEFSRTSLTSLREANASLNEELKVAHAEGDAKDKRIAHLETRLADATASAHDWHLKAKELETQLQAAKANEEWARSIVAHSVTRSAPQGSGSQGTRNQGSQLVYRKVHILGVEVHNVQFGATGTRRQGKDWRRACALVQRQ